MRHVDLTHAVWRKSSYSGGQGQCLEIAIVGAAVAARDSKIPGGPTLVFTPEGWRGLELTIRQGEFTERT